MMPVACTLSSAADLPPCDDRVAQLHQYWLSLRPSPDLLPGRQHFDPTDVPRLLPWILLVDVERDPLRFRYRLVGTENVRVKGYDATGQYLEERVPDFAAMPTYPQWRATVEHRQAAYHHGLPVRHVPKDFFDIERLLLPLARNGRDVDMILAMALFHVRSEPVPFGAGAPVLVTGK